MKQTHWHILGFFMAATLWACGGGAGGPGAALDGGGAGGGPVGGGNFAAGPMSLPAPSVVSPDNPVLWANISCTNVPGPTFECKGTDNSVQPGTEIQFKIYAPAAGVARETFTTTANPQGAWSVSHAGVAGESVEICPKEKSGLCGLFREVKLPPEPLTVEGNSGTFKNLVFDPAGSWHSQLLPKLSSAGRLFASLFISEARAEPTALRPFTPVMCAGALPLLEIVGDAPAAAPKPQCILYRQMHGSPASIPTIHFDDCVQNDIRSVISLRHPRSGQPVLLVAVKNRVHVVETQPSPRVVWEYSFPGNVVSILDQGDRFVAVVDAPVGTANNLFYVDLRLAPPAGTGCYPPLNWLKGVENVTSSDSLNETFTMVVYKGIGQYQVVLGRHVPGSTEFRNQPWPLLPASTNPLEAKLLKVEQNWVWVAVLNAVEKKITIVKHFMPNADVVELGGEPDQVQTISLENLTVGSVNLTVTRPQLFNVNRATNEMVFVDISEQGSKFVVLPYTWASGNIGPITVATVTDLVGASPASLRYDSTAGRTGWAYDDGSTMEIRRVRTQRDSFQFNLPSSVISEGLILYYQPSANPPAEEADEE